MANDDLDLTRGKPTADSEASARRSRRRERTASTAPPPEAGPTESEVRVQIGRALDGIAKSREAKEDYELAEALREEGDAMTEGFVTLTNNVTPLRMPLVILLNLAITLLAFGRVGGILLGRLADRRSRRQAQAEEEAGVVQPGYEGVTEFGVR